MHHRQGFIRSKVLHSNQSFASGIPPRSTGGSLFAVCSKVERDEEDEVGRENAHASKSSKLLTRTISCVWHVREVGAREVCVGCEVDEDKVDDELDDLKHSDILLPPNANTTGRLKVVPGDCQPWLDMQCVVCLTST